MRVMKSRQMRSRTPRDAPRAAMSSVRYAPAWTLGPSAAQHTNTPDRKNYIKWKKKKKYNQKNRG